MDVTVLARLRGLDLLSVRGARPIVRRTASGLDEARLSWASDFLADPGAQEVVRAVVEAPDTWGNALLAVFPMILRSGSGPDPASRDMSRGPAALVRFGFILVQGIPLAGITASAERVPMMGPEFVRHEDWDPSPTAQAIPAA